MYNGEGKVAARYEYGADGNHKVYNSNGTLVSSESTSEAMINPFRYKGYYYDVETQLYWVSSRYYSPEFCRWLTPDSIDYLEPTSINGLNLYAYCGNDPINNIDPSGHAWYHWAIGIGVLVLAAAATIVTAGAAGVGIGAAFAAGFTGTAIGSGAIGVAATISASVFAGAVVGGAVGFLAGGITMQNGKLGWNWNNAAVGFLDGVITGAISGGVGGALTKTALSTTTVNCIMAATDSFISWASYRLQLDNPFSALGFGDLVALSAGLFDFAAPGTAFGGGWAAWCSIWAARGANFYYDLFRGTVDMNKGY